MAGDAVLTRDGPVAVPLDYQVPAGGEMQPLSVRATVDGTSAASSFYAVVQVISPSGRVMGTYISAAIVAGASADVTWFPWGGEVGASPAPSPNPLGTVWAWYDFSDASTITLDGSGKIQAVRDKTGNGHDLGQSTAANRPSETTVNGLNAALCNSTTFTYLIGGPWSPSLAAPYTTFVVHTLTSASHANYFPGALGGPNSTNQVLFQVDTFSRYFLQLAASTIVGPSITTPFTQNCFTAVIDGGGSSLRVNGSSTAGTLSSLPLANIAVGAAHIPARPPLVEALDGSVCEALYYEGHLTTAQLQAVEAYLKAKWATP